MGYWLRHTIGAIFTNKDVTAHTSKEDMAISQFQSMCTALAGTIGTGNIVGVATAIVSGGPGAIFWMWVMALRGMMTSFAENVLGVYYRRKNEKGEWSGGAMYYLTDGLGAKPGCKRSVDPPPAGPARRRWSGPASSCRGSAPQSASAWRCGPASATVRR